MFLGVTSPKSDGKHVNPGARPDGFKDHQIQLGPLSGGVGDFGDLSCLHFLGTRIREES